MSDITPAAPAPDAPAADPAAQAPGGPAPDAVELQGLDALPESWQSHIRELRDGEAKYRTELKPYKDVFGAFDPQDREVLFGLAQALREDPRTGAQQMMELAQALLGGDEPDEGVDDTADFDEDRPLTRAEAEALWAAKQAEAQQTEAAQRAQAELLSEATALGYTEGSRGYWSLLIEAKSHGGDLKKAHEALVAEIAQVQQKAVDEFVSGRRADAESTPTAGSGLGTAPANDTPVRTFESARASTEARLRQARS